MRAVESCCFHCGCTLRSSKFFCCSGYQQYRQYCRDQAASNIEMTERLMSSSGRKPKTLFFSEPVAFRRVYGPESCSRTSRESNHHRQSVNATRVTSYQLSFEGNLENPKHVKATSKHATAQGVKSGRNFYIPAFVLL